ncbi:hypothetical protein ANCCAN_09354 [Ancylostoma caninum]|uniref:Uncharacterized protein n=1 Tax=Ancylostoma caninum TaxID=29170 RepID=A0A368GJS2_ANCCA|nr:hypothetical protein ANCCAN_09354 [Ancylostoma caninum]
MDQELDQSATGGAPGPPQDTLNTALTGHHLDHAQEVRALAILAMVVFGFLALVAILYAIRWMCLLTNNKVHKDSSELAEPEESSVRLGGGPADDDRVMSHTDQVSDSESAKRCYPSHDKMLELHLPKKKRGLEKEEGVSVQTLKDLPDYSKVVLKHDQMYVGGLSKHPKEPPSYISTLETPGTRKIVWPTQAISGTSVLKTARPPSRKSSSIDVMKIGDAPILGAPKGTTISSGSSINTAKEPVLVAASGQAGEQIVGVQPQLIAPPSGPAPAQAPGLLQPIPASSAALATPGPQPKPFTSSNLMITGKSSVRTASRAENARAANAVKVTAAPVSITAMRRKPLPKAFTDQTKLPTGQPDTGIKTAKSPLADLPVSTPPRDARGGSPEGSKTVSMTSRSSKSSIDAAPGGTAAKESTK